VGAYWVVLWHDMVSWTARRVALTAVATALALFIGAVVALWRPGRQQPGAAPNRRASGRRHGADHVGPVHGPDLA
jgi:hypothetical protein